MRVVFFGNHTVGVVALKALLKKVDIVGVVAHPEDPEDGVCYESVYKFALKHDIRVIRGRGKDSQVKDFLVSCNVDLIWVTDYRYMLPEDILAIPGNGGVNLHPSLLPKYRGRAPVNWAIINGDEEIGLTAHFLTSGMDDGDIIKQLSCKLSKGEDVGDALDKLMPLYDVLTSQVIQSFIDENVSCYKQNEAFATICKARKPDDGEINWQQSATQIMNLIRAVAAPYPGAFTKLQGTRVYIWKVELTCDKQYEQGKKRAGTILNVIEDTLVIVCGENTVKVTNYTFEKKGKIPINKGMLFGQEEDKNDK